MRKTAILSSALVCAAWVVQAQEYGISMVAGPTDSRHGFAGDGGPAKDAQLNNPDGVAVDRTGNLFIADAFNNRVRKVSPSGIITTLAGGGTSPGDEGPAVNASLAQPHGLAVDAAGNLFIAEYQGHRIRKVSASGVITTVAGTGKAGFSGDGGPATSAQLSSPWAVAVDGGGNLFIADHGNVRVRKVSAAGIITTVAGNGVLETTFGSSRVAISVAGVGTTPVTRSGFSGDGGLAVNAQMSSVDGVAVDAAGNLFIVDGRNLRIREVSPDGIITTAVGGGNMGFGPNSGRATEARLQALRAVAVDGGGNVFIVDGVQVLKISNGIMTPVAGELRGGAVQDRAPYGRWIFALRATLGGPMALAVDSGGKIYGTDNNSVFALQPLQSPDLKAGLWDVTEHVVIPLTAEQSQAFQQALTGADKYPANQRESYIAAIKAAEQNAREQAAKGTDVHRTVCLSREHIDGDLLFDSQRPEQCTAEMTSSGQKLTLHTTCASGNQLNESYAMERVDSQHFKGSVESASKENGSAFTMSKTFAGAWSRSDCAPPKQ